MPYYIFKVRQDKTSVNCIASHDKFHDASSSAKTLRRDLSTAENSFIKIIYAAEQQEGERLVLEKRQPSSPVEEWEV